MISQSEPGNLIDILTNIQSIYDRATNRTLLLRLRWPSSAPAWQELAKLAEKLSQARESFGAVLKILIQKRNGGVELACEVRHLKPLQGVVNDLHRSLLAPIEHVEAPKDSSSHPLETTGKLMQVSTDGQRNSLAALVRIFEEPQRQMSQEDRQSLAASLRRESLLSCLSSTDCSRGARDSIFAPLDQQIDPKNANERLPFERSTSLQLAAPISPADSIIKAADSNAAAIRKSSMQASNSLLPLPQRSSSLATIPVIEPETDHVFVLQRKPPTPPDELSISPIDSSSSIQKKPPTPPEDFPMSPIDGPTPEPRSNRPVGFPFLQSLDKTGHLKPIIMTTKPLDRLKNNTPAIPQFLSSPLSDGPMPQVPASMTPSSSDPSSADAAFYDAKRPSEIHRTHLALAGEGPAQGRFSPFSEPDYEASGSYFAPQQGASKTGTGKSRPVGRASSKTISHPLQHPFATPPELSAPNVTSTPPSKRLQLPPKLPSVDQIPIRPEIKRLMTTPYHPRPPPEPVQARPTLVRASTDFVPPRPPFVHASTEAIPPRPQLLTVPRSHPPRKDSRFPPRQQVLSIASPVDEAPDPLPQPSAWNDHLGFCVGAALAQLNRPGAMLQSKNVHTDPNTQLNFLKCSSNKCAFQGHGPADKIWEIAGVHFRRDFLVKSHCKQKKARHAIYAFQCNFCVLTRQKSPVIQGTEAFLAHVSMHRNQTFSPAILDRTKCVAGRKANPNEPFDINLVPITPPMPDPTPALSSVNTNPLDMYQALHSNPVER